MDGLEHGLHDVELIDELLRHNESEWLEFKRDNCDPGLIGELCSALSNGARLASRDHAYVIWGIEDGTKQVVGTAFNPETAKVGNQDLLPWLLSMLGPRPDVDFRKVAHPDGELILLSVSAAIELPTAFQGTIYVRVGSATQRLQHNPRLHKRLYTHLNELSWEDSAAKEHLETGQVLDLLDYEKYFQLMKVPRDSTPEAVCERFKEDGLVRKNDAGKWDITKLGAILFARSLSEFGISMKRNGIRLTIYNGSDKTSGVKDKMDGTRGYAVDFEIILERINLHNPVSERIGDSFRVDTPRFPKPAIRELLVNALIHQDFHISGAGPSVYLFSDKLEFDNPGESLVPAERMIDFPPRARNIALGDLMRRMDFCEERGSGLDMVIAEIESSKSPPPEFRVNDDSTQVVLHGPREFRRMTSAERLRACQQHAIIMQMRCGKMTHASLRTRFGLERSNTGTTYTSNIIREALDSGLIRYFDANRPRAGYIPNWPQISNGNL